MPQGTPRGFRDILPREALQREHIAQAVKTCFAEHGYLPVETPLMEYRDVLERGSALDDTPFQLFDDDELLVMRPDITLAIARMVSSRFAGGDLPLRLRYEAPVVREESNLRGQPRQLTQLGVELMGEDGATSEREITGLLAAAVLLVVDAPDLIARLERIQDTRDTGAGVSELRGDLRGNHLVPLALVAQVEQDGGLALVGALPRSDQALGQGARIHEQLACGLFAAVARCHVPSSRRSRTISKNCNFFI